MGLSDQKQTGMDIVVKALTESWCCCSRPIWLVVIFCLLMPLSGCSHVDPQVSEKPAKVPVVFRYEHPEAKNVSIVADFSRWAPQPMVKKKGTWSFEISLSPGLYLYAFLVDGHDWRPDPGAMIFDDDGFGKRNSVLIVE